MEEMSGTTIHNVRLSVGGNGNVCPACSGTQFTSKYTLGHVLVCLFFFPFGLISLAFPVKTCAKCGVKHGLGNTVDRFGLGCASIIIIVMVLILIGASV